MNYNNGNVIIFETKEAIDHIGRIVEINKTKRKCGTIFHLSSSEPCPLNGDSGLITPENDVSRLATTDEESQYELMHTMFTRQYRL